MRRGGARTTPALAAAALLLLAAAAEGGPARLQLRLRPRQGDSHRLRLTYSQNLRDGGWSGGPSFGQTFRLDCLFEVLRVDPAEGSSVRVTYQAVTFRQEGPGGVSSWDSARPANPPPPAARELAALAGRSAMIRISPDGRVSEVPGLDRHTVETLMSVYPPKPVGVGDSWPQEVDLGEFFPLAFENTWTFRERKGGVIGLSVRGALKAGPGPSFLKLGPLQVGYEISGGQEGRLELDEASGWPLRADLRHSFSGRLLVGPGISGGAPGPLTGEGRLQLERLRG